MQKVAAAEVVAIIQCKTHSKTVAAFHMMNIIIIKFILLLQQRALNHRIISSCIQLRLTNTFTKKKTTVTTIITITTTSTTIKGNTADTVVTVLRLQRILIMDTFANTMQHALRHNKAVM